MKLATYMAEIKRAYQSLMLDIELSSTRPQYSFDYHPQRPAHILPHERKHSRPPKLAPDYNPTPIDPPFSSKEKMVMLAACQATYQDSITPLTPDMVPVIIDTGASISLSPYETDFIGTIQPVQNVTLKGIASGLQVAGIGTIQHQFLNNKNVEQTITLNRCLYVPKCTVRPFVHNKSVTPWAAPWMASTLFPPIQLWLFKESKPPCNMTQLQTYHYFILPLELPVLNVILLIFLP